MRSFIKGSAKFIPVILSKPDVFHIQWAKAPSCMDVPKGLWGSDCSQSARNSHQLSAYYRSWTGCSRSTSVDSIGLSLGLNDWG